MIDITSEHLLTLAQAARIRPRGRNGRPTHICTIYRWIAHGVRGHRLEAIRLGGAQYTTREAMQRFAEKLTMSTTHAAAPPECGRRTTSDLVESELDRSGI